MEAMKARGLYYRWRYVVVLIVRDWRIRLRLHLMPNHIRQIDDSIMGNMLEPAFRKTFNLRVGIVTLFPERRQFDLLHCVAATL